MRIIKAVGLACGCAWAAAAVTLPAAAQEDCGSRRDALGVSRVLQIDTTGGPRFGFQYKEQDVLTDGEVVLTFDDGPLRSHSKLVLDALAAHCTKATFFLVGRMAVADPEMVKEYVRLGHTVGIHTWSHANLRNITPLKARTEIELGFSAVQQALGRPVAPFFRFPYLADSKSMTIHLQERNIGIFSIDVDSKDYRSRSPESVHRKVMTDLARTRKGIILFHDIQAATVRALPVLLADLKAKGYRIVHMQPKMDATTMPEFDVIAQQEFDRRRAIVTSQPLARRSLTWPATGVTAEPAAAPARAAPRAAPRYPQDDWLSKMLKW
jgi:peptidoglycan/xylan/chitin deacetylase (PgdA/CDA1 family)